MSYVHGKAGPIPFQLPQAGELVPPLAGQAGELVLVAQVQESREADQLSYHPGPDPASPHLRTPGAFNRAGPSEPKLQDLHDTGQQQDI